MTELFASTNIPYLWLHDAIGTGCCSMIMKMKPLKKVALTVVVIWTIIVTTLTANLIISSKKSAVKNAKDDAFSAIDHIDATIKLLINDYQINDMSLSRQLDLKGLESKSGVVFIELGIEKPKVSLVFVQENSNVSNQNTFLDEWQKKLLGVLIDRNETTYFIDEKGQSSFLRAVEPRAVDQDCQICSLVGLEKKGGYFGGVFVSVNMSRYLSEAYLHAWSMIRSIGIIWVLGIAAIIYGYKKTSSAVSKKLRNYEESVFNLVDIIEKRDSYTAGHTRRVAKYAMLLAEELNVSSIKKELLYRASMLHDIGKISTPDSILLKPGKLSDLEYKIIKNHVTTSYEILSKVSIYKDLAEIVRHHHEYYDGSGYPQGLKGAEIPFLSQILTVADGFDAMTTDRIYKGRKSVQEAIQEISKLSGQQFNPVIVQSAINVLSKVNTDRKISQLPESDLQHERFSYFYKDNVTHAYNQRYLELLLSKQKQELKKYRHVLLIRVHNFSKYNSEHSWSKGDEKLIEIVNSLQKFEENHLVFRLFGDDFILLLKRKIDSSEREELLRKEVNGTCLYYSTRYIDLPENKLIDMEELEKIMHMPE